jgi:hypothetical protein
MYCRVRTRKIYAVSGSRWSDVKGNWQVFKVTGGWSPREFSAYAELDHYAFHHNFDGSDEDE